VSSLGRPTHTRVEFTAVVFMLATVTSMAAWPLDLTANIVVDIAEQSLEMALLELSKQSHTQLVMATGSLPQVVSRPISGRMSLAEALHELLEGTGLTYKLVGQNTIAIMKSSESLLIPNAPRADGDSLRDGGAPLLGPHANEAREDNQTQGDKYVRETNVQGDKYMVQRGFLVRLAALFGVCASAYTPGSACAQDSTADSGQLSEIVVTAEKRTELLSRAPVAIAVVQQQQLDQLGISAASNLVTTVPNLQNSATTTGGTGGFAIRGIGNLSGSYSTVAVQVDGIYDPNFSALSLGLYDVDRIEVLRGPQGTVYGRNATAGVVNIDTANPIKTFEAFGDVAYGNYDDLTVRGVLNLPLGERIQIRASVVRRENDGYQDGGGTPRDYSITNVLSARLTGMVEFTDNLSWRLSFSRGMNRGTLDYSHIVNYLYYPSANLISGVLGNPVVTPARGNLFGQESEPDNSIDTVENTMSSRLTWSPNDSFSATYLAGFSRFADNGVDFATGLFGNKSNDLVTKATTHELDFNFRFDKFNAVAGLYYYSDRQTGYTDLHIANTVPSPFNTVVPGALYPTTGNEPSAYGAVDILQNNVSNPNTSKAVFTQATYNVTDELRLTGGARYTKDTAGSVLLQQVCAYGTGTIVTTDLSCGVPFGPVASSDQSVQSSNTSWKATLEYDLTRRHLLYATVATGYRGGGVSGNGNLPTQYLTYAPETVTNYELGLKNRLFNNSVSIDLTVFRMDYKSMQVSTVQHDLNGNPTPVTTNAASSTIQGIEAEFDWRITTNDEIKGFATYLDAKFSSFPNAVNPAVNPDGIYNSDVGPPYAQLPVNVPTDLSGKRLPNAPDETFRIDYDHRFALGTVGELIPSAQVYWQSATFADISNSSQGITSAHSSTDLNLAYTSPSNQVTVDAYVHHLENSIVHSGVTAGWAYTSASYLPPRTFGVRVGYKFK